jgi:hypothetical protein
VTVVDLIASIVAILGGVVFIFYVAREAIRGAPERRAEDEAREFYDQHGFWPDEGPAPT